jgi:hypothetical protein
MKQHRHPCFEGCNDYPRGVEPCLEGRGRDEECLFLERGKTWKACDSGGKNSLLEYYRQGECKTPGEAIRRLRQYAGLSLRKAAEDLKVDAVILGEWERGK